jgi:hypothetical protein
LNATHSGTYHRLSENVQFIVYSFIFSTAVSCPSLNILYADLNTTTRLYQTYVNVSCQKGYQYTDNEYWIVTECQADKTWSTLPADCTGKPLAIHVLNSTGQAVI